MGCSVKQTQEHIQRTNRLRKKSLLTLLGKCKSHLRYYLTNVGVEHIKKIENNSSSEDKEKKKT